MNIDFTFKKGIDLFAQKKTEASCVPPLAKPIRDWQLLLLGMVALIIMVSVWAGLIYANVTALPSAAGEDTASGVVHPLLDGGALARLLSARDARAQLHTQYESGL